MKLFKWCTPKRTFCSCADLNAHEKSMRAKSMPLQKISKADGKKRETKPVAHSNPYRMCARSDIPFLRPENLERERPVAASWRGRNAIRITGAPGDSAHRRRCGHGVRRAHTRGSDGSAERPRQRGMVRPGPGAPAKRVARSSPGTTDGKTACQQYLTIFLYCRKGTKYMLKTRTEY